MVALQVKCSAGYYLANGACKLCEVCAAAAAPPPTRSFDTGRRNLNCWSHRHRASPAPTQARARADMGSQPQTTADQPAADSAGAALTSGGRAHVRVRARLRSRSRACLLACVLACVRAGVHP